MVLSALDRKEFKIVQYRGVKKIEVISPEGLSQEFEELKNHGALHSESENAWDNYFDKVVLRSSFTRCVASIW